MIVDFDDFGMDHTISDMCRTRDCRKELDILKEANPDFKVTLFTVPAYTTLEILDWAKKNREWIELAVHGWDHHDNYECEDWSALTTENRILKLPMMGFKKLFKAPGWQIGDGVYKALEQHGWAVADQGYNNDRRPKDIPAYVIDATGAYGESVHGHTWDCMGNGIEETLDQLIEKVKGAPKFYFVSEVVL